MSQVSRQIHVDHVGVTVVNEQYGTVARTASDVNLPIEIFCGK